jgi:hypothetical protein
MSYFFLLALRDRQYTAASPDEISRIEPGSGVTASGPPPEEPGGMYTGGGINHHPLCVAAGVTAGGNLSGEEFRVANVGGAGTGSLKGMAPSSSSGEGSSGEPVSSGTSATRFPQRVRATIVPSVMSVSPGCKETFLRVQ